MYLSWSKIGETKTMEKILDKYFFFQHTLHNIFVNNTACYNLRTA